MTFGLKLTKSESGYIRIWNDNVLSFREKRNLETVQEFIEFGAFLKFKNILLQS